MNKLFVSGVLVSDPDMRTTAAGKEVCNMRIAVRKPTKVKEGEPNTDFVDIAAWGELGKRCGRYLKKKSKIAAVGTATIKTYLKKDGNYSSQLFIQYADQVDFLHGIEDNSTAADFIPKGTGNADNDRMAAPIENNSEDDFSGFLDVTDDNELPF